MKWRPWFRAIHRDLGYVAVALTLTYALSGIAVNHLGDWNPNYTYATRAIDLGPLPVGEPLDLAAMEAFVVGKLGVEPGAVRGHFQETATDFRVFLADGQEARVDVGTGVGSFKTLARRPLFFQVNALHLNNLKGIWTWVADGFAVALMLLALTGMTMMKGKRGLAGRGKWFVAGGLVIPIGFVIYMYAGA